MTKVLVLSFKLFVKESTGRENCPACCCALFEFSFAGFVSVF